jgi:carboxyl-terminal processing protease
MKQPSKLPRVLVTSLGIAIASTVLAPALVFKPLAPAAVAFEDSPKAVLDEAWQIVYREYVDTTFNNNDWVAIRQDLLGQEYSSRQQAYAELRRALRRLNDPYTRFLDPDQYADLTEQTSGEMSGVGLRLQRDRSTNSVLVVDTLPDSPAQRANIQSGDRLLMVNGRSTDTLNIEAVSQLIRGEIGTQVTLTIRRATGGRQETLILTRERLEVTNVTYEVREQNDMRIGYIRLDEFSAHAAEQMEEAIKTLETEDQVEAFVLDLRDNPGGLLQASIDIGRMWLPRGPIVRTVDRSGDSEEISANRSALSDLPLAVLVNGQSASSSEILTGALNDNNRAVVVGTPTFGKALVQSLHALSDGSGIAVTIAHYYTPDGTDISTKGITPDIQVDLSATDQQALTNNPTLLGTPADPQFVRAVAALEADVLARRQPQQQTSVAAPANAVDPPQLVRNP